MSKKSNNDIDLSLAETNDGLPFVFAVWAVRSDCKNIDEIEKIVINAALGNKFISLIAERFSNQQGNSISFGKTI